MLHKLLKLLMASIRAIYRNERVGGGGGIITVRERERDRETEQKGGGWS